MRTRVLIVGGGLAGLSAAAALAERGLTVTLLESRPRLGGRAGSFLDKETGEWIDTCQHVGMGCCTNLLHFCRMVGIDELLREEHELTFIGPSGERSRFRENDGPAPLHLGRALMGLRYLTAGEKLRLALDLRMLMHSQWATQCDLSFADWLTQHSRSIDLRQRFWDVILVSALSETAERIAVPFARQVFVDGFLANRDGWRVHLPTAPLDELYGQRLAGWLRTRGATVRTQARVERLEERDGHVVAAQLQSGERIAADEFVIAVPWHRVKDIVPASLVAHPMVVGASQLEAAPISSVHLWFDRPVLDVPHAVLVGRLSQWVFARPHGSRESSDESREKRPTGANSLMFDSPDHGITRSEPGISVETTHAGAGCVVLSPLDSRLSTLNPQLTYLQVVISASREVTAKPQAETVATVVAELAEIWPHVTEARLVHSRMVTEHRAVFSPQPGVEQWRPSQHSPIANLQLAGDWTRTGWPATMEGAVRSGYLAAENVLKRLGREAPLVQPGLPVGRLARWMISAKPAEGD